ncbi:TPA: (2Fe-2S) ferredoxin domain-containing protein [Legionella pneumophila]|nr:ferredoxin, 2Fe-2S [Legionella pneumophila]HAT9433421.1 (2Fe-2S) ferredoxin domain-containing protein [Legionella pneumophila subsp. pneumophila]HAT1727528.1 (2Fe-2S) ferredoxin domain-containing protein [Legionella pneumophila]HAT1886713.1 (2Fe-2S) ferredoxin domain-containing protein [Legionella pneumophila]HAU0921656.1 (2Fe-2S) ferredoxin domain-containing protein [Legionella pneumophila]
MSHYTKHVFICTNQKAPGKQCCANSGGEEFFDFMKSKLLEFDLHSPGKIRVSKSGCLGRCGSGPCIVIYPEGVWYTYSSFEDIEQIIKYHLIDGEIVEPLLLDR